MKVYVVSLYVSNGEKIRAIFSTREKAEEYIKLPYNTDLDIDEYEVDSMLEE